MPPREPGISVAEELQRAVEGADPTEVVSLSDALADPGDLPYSVSDKFLHIENFEIILFPANCQKFFINNFCQKFLISSSCQKFLINFFFSKFSY